MSRSLFLRSLRPKRRWSFSTADLIRSKWVCATASANSLRRWWKRSLRRRCLGRAMQRRQAIEHGGERRTACHAPPSWPPVALAIGDFRPGLDCDAARPAEHARGQDDGMEESCLEADALIAGAYLAERYSTNFVDHERRKCPGRQTTPACTRLLRSAGEPPSGVAASKRGKNARKREPNSSADGRRTSVTDLARKSP